MLRSELIKRLRAEAERKTPNVYKKVMAEARAEDLFYDLRVRNYRNNNNGNRSGNRSGRSSKPLGGGAKALVGLSTSLVVLACASVAGFAFFGEQIVGLFTQPTTPPSLPLLSLSGNYAVGAVSAARLLSESVSEDGTFADGGADGVDLQAFDRYFTAFSMFGQNINVACADNDAQNDFRGKATVKAQNYYGVNYDYCIYYTEAQKTGTDERTMTGEIKLDGTNYYLRGERRVDGENDVWLTLKVFAGELDGTTYVQVDSGAARAAASGNELEYRYTIVKDGNKEGSVLKTGGGVIYSLNVGGDGGWNYRVKGFAGELVKIDYVAGGKSGEISAKQNGAKYEYVLSEEPNG